VTPPRTPLGRLLKARRERLGYSRTRASQLSGVNASSLEAWELGRVSKPPIHDVIRLARTLSISMGELERSVLEGAAGDAPAQTASGHVAAAGDDQPLVQRAVTLLDWSDAQAAEVLGTTPERIVALRAGDGELTVLEMVTVIGELTRFPQASGGASEQETMLARLLRTRV
jgi:transcriptional regulator with XRE-family HTH domain